MSKRKYLYEFTYGHKTDTNCKNLKSNCWAYSDEEAYKFVCWFVGAESDWQVLEVKRVEGVEE